MMKVLDVKVEWNFGYHTPPEFYVLFDDVPKDLVYSNRSWAYYAEKDGYVSFFAYQRPGDGFGGRTFNLNMDDGSVRKLIGPWSSSAAEISKVFAPCSDIVFTTEQDVWKRGYTFLAGAITLDMYKTIAQKYGCGIGKHRELYCPDWWDLDCDEARAKRMIYKNVKPYGVIS